MATRVRETIHSVVLVDEEGEPTSLDIALEASDIEIGAVEIKDGTTDNRAVVSASGELSTLDAGTGAVADAAVVTDTTGSVSGKLRGLVKWAFERMPASLGSKTSAASFPVVIASDQGAVAVTATISDGSGPVTVDGTVTVTGVATAAEQATQTASLSVLDDWDESDRAKVNPIAGQAGVAAGAGAVGATVQRTTLASDDPAVATLGATGDAAVDTDTTGSVSGKLRGLVKLFAARIPAALTAGGGLKVGNVDAIPAGTNNIGQISQTPQTANGLSVLNATSSDGGTALTSTAQAIKASAGQVYGWFIYNPNPTAQFVQFYNTAQGSVTVGTTAPLFMLTIPAASGANVEFANGITFSNAGFSCAATATAGGNGAPATALDAVIFYK